MRWMLIGALIGACGCAPRVDDAGICRGLGREVAALRRGLDAHPETPDAVGEPAVNVVIGFSAGCGGR